MRRVGYNKQHSGQQATSGGGGTSGDGGTSIGATKKGGCWGTSIGATNDSRGCRSSRR